MTEAIIVALITVAGSIIVQVMIARANTRDLYAKPMHPYTWGLLDSIPRLTDDSKGMLRTIPGVPPDLRLTGTSCNFCNRCAYAKDICHKEVPPLVEVEPGHFVACHLQNGQNKLAREEGEVR